MMTGKQRCKNAPVKGYIITIFTAFALAILLGTVFAPQEFNERDGRKAEKWVMSPETRDGDFYYTFTLPEQDIEGTTLAFQMAHFECEVTIGQEVVTAVHAENPRLNKSTGYRWNFIELRQADAGKEVTVHMISVYHGQRPKDVFYYGSEYKIVQAIWKTEGSRFLLAVLILFIGIMLFMYASFVLLHKHMDDALLHFSIFSILLACWSITESPICSLLGIWPVGTMVIDHYALMLMPMPFMLFLRLIFSSEDHPGWKIYGYANMGIITLRTLLQVTTLFDLKQTLWMTQFSIVAFLILASVIILGELRITKITRQIKINLFFIFFIFAATVLELALFRVFQKSSIFGMLGFVFYVSAMSVEMVKKTRKIVERAHEAELYQKLAYTDELTGVYNRTAFQHDLDNQITVDKETGSRTVKKNTVFIFDLNDLKRCNDTYGHESGDRYIKMVADALLRVFGIDARCYRIGGDEFCAIMPNTNQNEIDHKIISLNRTVQELDRKGFVVPVSVAVGYAVYQSECDETLKDTLRRADVLMYKNKQMLKKARG